LVYFPGIVMLILAIGMIAISVRKRRRSMRELALILTVLY
jgi:hypothetical protein